MISQNVSVYDILSRYEKSQIISFRAKEISNGSKVELDSDEIKKLGSDPLVLAKREFEMKRINVSIKRKNEEIINLI